MSFTVDGARVAVMGGGRSGCAAAALLVSKGARVTLTDQTQVHEPQRSELEKLGVRIDVGPHSAADLAAADLIVLSPGVPPHQPALDPARAAGVPIIGEVELASRWIAGRIIAITGTKGKSTTTTLTALMLQAAGFTVTAGGNLGTPLSAQVETSTRDALHVVEVSSFQLETIESFHPWIAVVVNLSPDHLDRHASFAEYAWAKSRVFLNQEPGDWAVVNADDPAAMDIAAGARSRRFDFALDHTVAEGVTVERDQVVAREGGRSRPLFPVSAVRLRGRHLLADVLAAAAVSTIAAAPATAMQAAAFEFAGLEHALEHVLEVDGVSFVNDSKATNVVSVRRSLESFERGVVAIIGGRYKGGDFGELRDTLRARADGVVVIGEAAGLIRDAIGDAVPVAAAASMGEAVKRAYTMASPGGTVVLAPGCSSFDMFADYAARGRTFKDEVRRLAVEMKGVRS